MAGLARTTDASQSPPRRNDRALYLHPSFRASDWCLTKRGVLARRNWAGGTSL